MNPQVYIASFVRTPIGSFNGAFADIPAAELGGIALKEAVRRSRIPAERLNDVFMGNVLSAGLGQNPARQAAIAAGLPVSIGATTVSKVCGSGLQSVILGAMAIQSGDAHAVVAGGMENDARPLLA